MPLPITKTLRFFQETYAGETLFEKHGVRNVVQVIITGNGDSVTVLDIQTTKSIAIADGLSRIFPAENIATNFTLTGPANVECYIKE